jgi:hypothetical protein
VDEEAKQSKAFYEVRTDGVDVDHAALLTHRTEHGRGILLTCRILSGVSSEGRKWLCWKAEDLSFPDRISVSLGDGGNPSPSGEEKVIRCRYATV